MACSKCRFLLLISGILWPQLATAATISKGALPGRMVDAPDGQGQMELVSLDAGLAPALLGVPLEGSVAIEDWPVAPGIRRTVVVAHQEVYASDARIVAIDHGRQVEVPRSRLLFFWGSTEADGSTAVLITLDPDTGVVSGSTMSPDGGFDLHAPSAGRPEQLLAPAGALTGTGTAGGFQCGVGDLLLDPSRARQREARLLAATPQSLSTMHTGVVAVDTDNELMLTKFGDNTTTAANYFAQLFAGLNAIYQRDLFVKLYQGYTILRLSTTPDPWAPGAGGNADGTKLNEASAYWNANYSGVKRMLVVMLSGKQPGAGSWSGTAWIGGLCETYYGLSFNQVPQTGTTAGTSDFQLVGHEMGHNFGSRHTHCTDTDALTTGIQPIDFCNSTECGANWNPNPGVASCPAISTVNPINGAPVTAVKGTLMSYCHQLAGCGVTNVFHEKSVSLAIGPEIGSAVGQCIFPLTANVAPTVTSIAPASGLTTGGTAVTIAGANFLSPASVAFADLGGGQAATSVTVVNPTTITATIPAHTAGLTDVVVTNPDQQTGTLRSAYTYIQALAATAISPNGGSTAGGTPLTITGGGFLPPATVTLGGTAATAVSVVSPTTITATIPAHTAGLTDVVVTNPDQQTGTLRSAYTYIQALAVTTISPNGGSTAGGTPLTITGGGFLAPATVTLGGTAATAVSVVSPTTITATTAAHAGGVVDVVVVSSAQTATLAGGYWYLAPAAAAKFYTLTPCRLVDTRNANGPLGGPALVASARRNFTLTSVCGIPTTAKAVSVNVTVTGSTAPGHLTLFPGNGIAPGSSTINFSTGQTRANNALVLLATDGSGSLAVLNGAAGAVHFVLDVTGYFQ